VNFQFILGGKEGGGAGGGRLNKPAPGEIFPGLSHEKGDKQPLRWEKGGSRGVRNPAIFLVGLFEYLA
jgi:hypothetical protein